MRLRQQLLFPQATYKLDPSPRSKLGFLSSHPRSSFPTDTSSSPASLEAVCNLQQWETQSSSPPSASPRTGWHAAPQTLSQPANFHDPYFLLDDDLYDLPPFCDTLGVDMDFSGAISSVVDGLDVSGARLGSDFRDPQIPYFGDGAPDMLPIDTTSFAPQSTSAQTQAPALSRDRPASTKPRRPSRDQGGQSTSWTFVRMEPGDQSSAGSCYTASITLAAGDASLAPRRTRPMAPTSADRLSPDRSDRRHRNTAAARRYRRRKEDVVVALRDELEAAKKERDEFKMRCLRAEAENNVLKSMMPSRPSM